MLSAFAVLDGHACSPVDVDVRVGATKLLGIMVSDETDTTIDEAGLRVRWSHRRYSIEYHPWLAAELIANLRSSARDGRVDVPFSLNMHVFERRDRTTRSPQQRWLWIVRAPGEIRIACRTAQANTPQPPVAQSLPMWTPAPPRFLRFRVGRACASCGASSERFRLLRAAIVCPRCGCSERIDRDERAGAIVES